MFSKVKYTAFPTPQNLFWSWIRRFQRPAVPFAPGYGVGRKKRTEERGVQAVGGLFYTYIYRGQRTPTSRGDGRRRVRLLDNRGKSTDSGEKVW